MPSTEAHYNLIVFGDASGPMFQQSSGEATFRAERLLEFTDRELRDRYENDFAGLARMPALVVAEADFEQRARPAFLARIDGLEQRGRNVHFMFDHLTGGFTSEEVFNSGHFDIEVTGRGITERFRTHWAVKRGDVVAAVSKLLADPSTPAERGRAVGGSGTAGEIGQAMVFIPADPTFEPVYGALRTACEARGMDVIRLDQIYGADLHSGELRAEIKRSRFVISDLTGSDPNVLYETGFAEALDGGIVIIVQSEQDIPLELTQHHCILYDPTEEGLQELGTKLEQYIQILERQR